MPNYSKLMWIKRFEKTGVGKYKFFSENMAWFELISGACVHGCVAVRADDWCLSGYTSLPLLCFKGFSFKAG